MREPVSPLCFLLPAQYQQFLDVSDALGFGTDWILKPIQSIPGSESSSQNHPERLDIFSKEGKDKLRMFATRHGIIQQLVSSPLLVYGQPVNLQFFLLVTSIEPLRVFVHSKGLVYHRSSSNQTCDFQKVRKQRFVSSITNTQQSTSCPLHAFLHSFFASLPLPLSFSFIFLHNFTPSYLVEFGAFLTSGGILSKILVKVE